MAPAASSPQVTAVAVPPSDARANLRAIRVVWRREIIRFRRDRLRMVTTLIQPILFLFVLGAGLSPLTGPALGGVSLQTFLYPGVLTLAVLFTSVFSAGSIVWDREFGFLREMMVAPVSRSSIVIGKVLGGATVATFQGIILLLLGPLVGVPYQPVMMLVIVGLLLVVAVMVTAAGVVVAARIKTFQAFMAATQLLLMPLFFLSGALFPLNNLPTWLQVLTHINPLTYAVDMIRRTMFGFMDVGSGVAVVSEGVQWGSWTMPVVAELGVVIASAVILLAIGVALFRKG